MICLIRKLEAPAFASGIGALACFSCFAAATYSGANLTTSVKGCRRRISVSITFQLCTRQENYDYALLAEGECMSRMTHRGLHRMWLSGCLQ